MARPRVFVSSTYYDLKHVRSALDVFIESLGYDSILSEKGDIAYTFDRALDESCYREVGTADIFVVIIGGRYGSRASSQPEGDTRGKDRYDSITRRELEMALERGIPTYILIEKAVHVEYFTYLNNKETPIRYAHVDSLEIFKTIEKILELPKNNPIHAFEKFEEIGAWLREQWAGLFRELLHRTSTDQRIADLAGEVSSLHDVNETLKRYLERLVTTDSLTPAQRAEDQHITRSGAELVQAEEERLAKLRLRRELRANPAVAFLARSETDADFVIDAIENSKSFKELFDFLSSSKKNIGTRARFLHDIPAAHKDINNARKALGKSSFKSPKKTDED